jgi:hypothetical protein
MAAKFGWCYDDTLMEPVDMIHWLLYPNHGYGVEAGDNVCFQPRHFHFPTISDLLPPASDYFLPLDLVDGVIALLLTSGLLTVALVVAKYTWDFIDPYFKAISPSHKKWYVVANMSKGIILGLLCISPKYWIGSYKCFIQDECQLVELKRSVVIFITTDLVALFLVPKLPFTTVMHHTVVTIVSIILFSINIGTKGFNDIFGVAKLSVFYGVCSTVPFSVNLYLALRVVYPKSFVVSAIRWIALVSYVICCFFNWSVHLYWLVRLSDFSIYSMVYMGLLVSIVRDDIILMSWLARRASPLPEGNANHIAVHDKKHE